MKEIITIILFLQCQLAITQTWPKIYGIEEKVWGNSVIEIYDKGYLVNSQVDPGFGGVDQMHAWLLKTDINGIKLWDKKIYNSSYAIATNDISQTQDGGMILIGSTSKYDPGEYDVFFLKINACGEKEWCTVLNTPGNSDFGLKLLPVDNGYVGLLSYYQDWLNKRVWTIKLDLAGNVVWKKVYFQEDPGYRNEQACDIMVTPDDGFIVAADGWYDPAGGWNGHLYSILIKTDSLGNEQWITRWGEENSDYYSWLPTSPALSESGNYYCANTHIIYSGPSPGVSPGYIKTSPTGQELLSVDLLTNTESGITTRLHFLYPDTLIMACGWRRLNEDYQEGVIKCDTNANNIIVKVLLDSVINTFQGSTLTFDQKMVLVGGFTKLNNTSDLYIFKINSNLDLDSLYTMPRTYDTLCPYQIVSDTLDLEDCGIYTSLKDPDIFPESYQLKAYPVPAYDNINFTMPEELVVNKTMNGVKVQTIYHQWDKTTLQIYNLQGHLIFEKEIDYSQKEIKIDCYPWKNGMYLARLMYNSSKVGESKIMILE
ncbi:MAG: T9SS type A sorting domain-containing protein [Chloroflexota bacterium]